METPKDTSISTAISTDLPFPDPVPTLPNQRSATHHSNGLRNEHGHSLTRIQPMSRHSGDSVATFFTGLFTTIIGLASLGSSITFSYVISNQTPPPLHPSGGFSQATVQEFLSNSWLLFLLALGFASLGSTMLTFFKEHWKTDWDGRNGERSQTSVQLYASVTIAVLGGLVIAAFMFLCLVVVAYAPVIGYIALSFTGLFGLIILVSVLYQAPWPWRNNKPTPRRAATA